MHALILALHESETNSAQVVRSLKQSGHNVLLVRSYTDAIKVLQTQHIDLIISDIHLENGGNVFDFLRWAKNNPPTKDTPFVMFSSEPTSTAKFLEDGLRTSARSMPGIDSGSYLLFCAVWGTDARYYWEIPVTVKQEESINIDLLADTAQTLK